MLKGKIKWYDIDSGYGFIEAEEGYDIYMHASSIRKSDKKKLSEGDKVTFEMGGSKAGPEAVNVKRVREAYREK